MTVSLYLEITELLKHRHGYQVSLSTIKRRLREKGCKKRALVTARSPRSDVYQAVLEELRGCGSLMGYRRVHRSLLSKGIICRREDIRKMMKDIYPEGVDLRRRRRLRRREYTSPGPNFAWHIDGHDKLKLYGFCIHGCIDGFSRKLLWLEVGPSNKMPEIIATYCLNTIQKIGGVPAYIKADDGTEHSLIQPIHVYLRSLDGNQSVTDSFSIVTSPRNQRIEAYWSILQRDRIGWWRRFFIDLTDLDLFANDDPVILDCVRFCFMDLIRKDLASIVNDWNAHIISSSRYGGPRGRPDSMYYLPHLFDAEDYLVKVENDEIEEFIPCVTTEIEDCSAKFKEFSRTIMLNDNIEMPDDPSAAFRLVHTFTRTNIHPHLIFILLSLCNAIIFRTLDIYHTFFFIRMVP